LSRQVETASFLSAVWQVVVQCPRSPVMGK
jgi:hypothetical protein